LLISVALEFAFKNWKFEPRRAYVVCCTPATGREVDLRARAQLWKNGWDYNHGTGHGIGYWLNVHEGTHHYHRHYHCMSDTYS